MNSKIHRRLELLDSKARKFRIKGMRGGSASAEINITPLADVVLVLLIIFMVVLKKIDATIELPKAFDPKVVGAQEDPLEVYITCIADKDYPEVTPCKTSLVIIDGVATKDEDVTNTISTALKKNPFRRVNLFADKKLKFNDIRKMLESFRDSGVNTAELMSEPFKELGN